jgi:hypothetical protein
VTARKRAKASQLPAGWHPGPDYPDRDPVQPPIPVGARVRLTGRFLRNTGQIAGGEGNRVWKVVPCQCDLCAGKRFVAVDEKSVYHPDEPAQPRHIASANLEDMDRMAESARRGAAKLIARNKPWEKLYRKLDRECASAREKGGTRSYEYLRAKQRLAFAYETRARSDARLDYEEVFGPGSDPERYWHIISPIDQARMLSPNAPELGGIEEMMKENDGRTKR